MGEIINQLEGPTPNNIHQYLYQMDLGIDFEPMTRSLSESSFSTRRYITYDQLEKIVNILGLPINLEKD